MGFYTQLGVSYLTDAYLSKLFPLHKANEALLINASIMPDPSLIDELMLLKDGYGLFQKDNLLAYRCSATQLKTFVEENAAPEYTKNYHGSLSKIEHTWDIFKQNGAQIKLDYKLLTAGRISEPIVDRHTVVYGLEHVFVEEGVKIKNATLNAEGGPIYLGHGSEIQEGALIRGPFALGEGSVVNMGAKIKGDTTIGAGSKVGGELSNVVIHSYTNKGHDGFLGNSVLGSWCNLGADTNCSNLKNNYATVKVWSYEKEAMVDTGLQFCGLIMGDHSKAGINTMFNTGTVVGVGCNIFGGGFPEAFIPSFSWGGPQNKWQEYDLQKMLQTAEMVMGRRDIKLDESTYRMLSHVYQQSHKNRKRFFLL